MVQFWAYAWWTPKVAVALEGSHSLKASGELVFLAFNVENWKHFLGNANFKGEICWRLLEDCAAQGQLSLGFG